jgi:hypothetical protein
MTWLLLSPLIAIQHNLVDYDLLRPFEPVLVLQTVFLFLPTLFCSVVFGLVAAIKWRSLAGFVACLFGCGAGAMFVSFMWYIMFPAR